MYQRGTVRPTQAHRQNHMLIRVVVLGVAWLTFPFALGLLLNLLGGLF